ncbi:MAG TPA: PLP-dependent aminotransferase family protein [Actinocrinis sp.]|jgi:GntR family transcriptional regulator/MocR family aminotransferase
MAEPRTNPTTRVADLLVLVDRGGGSSLHRQIEAAIRDAIRAGRLPRGAALPPTRAMAADLGVSRGVVVEAYQQLTAEGYLSSRSGGYTQVAADPQAAVRPGRADPAGLAAGAAGSGSGGGGGGRYTAGTTGTAGTALRIDFRYGQANPAHFPRSAWLRSVNRALTQAPTDRFSYLDGRGVPECRQALADYLNRVRGTIARPDGIVVCNGYAQGVSLLIHVASAAGARRLAVEDPSAHDDAVPLAAAASLEVVGVPVDEHGIRVDLLEHVGADLVVVTPSHQWPTGAVLGPDARAALIRWAERSNALIIEDDYDAEYRYDRDPIGAIQGLGPDRVAYAGTASKTLAPGLRLGWLVLPERLVGPVAAAKIAADRGSAVTDQLAFADFLACGEFDRHLRRTRPVYRRRRDALLAALARRLPAWEPAGISAGFHLIAWLPDGLGEDEVVAAAASRGVGVYGIASNRMTPGRPGVLFGYAGLTEQAIAEGVALIAGALSQGSNGAAGRRARPGGAGPEGG